MIKIYTLEEIKDEIEYLKRMSTRFSTQKAYEMLEQLLPVTNNFHYSYADGDKKNTIEIFKIDKNGVIDNSVLYPCNYNDFFDSYMFAKQTNNEQKFLKKLFNEIVSE